MPLFEPIIRRPNGLDEFEAHVMASNYPAICMIDRDLVRELLRYLRRLEAEAAGSFW
jgi:hypothetical protein